MRVDLTTREEQGWFDIRDGAKVHLRLLSETDIAEMRAACITVVPEYPLLDGKYQRFEAQKFDGALFERMRVERTILGWSGVQDANGVDVPVTAENKLLLVHLVPDFAKAVDAGLKALKDAEAARLEAREKN